MRFCRPARLEWIVALAIAAPSLAFAQIDFQPPVARYGGITLKDLAIADVNEDGWPDVVTVNLQTDTYANVPHVAVFLGGPNGLHQPPATHLLGPSQLNCLGVALGDLDRDGHLDALVSGWGVTAYYGDGTGSFAPPVPYSGNTEMRDVALVDFNGDGWLDAAYANGFNHTASVSLGNESGGLGPKTDYDGATAPYHLAAGDLSGDGVPDIVMSGYGSSGVSFHRGLGDGTFARRSMYAAGGRPMGVALGDLDGDGRLDAVVGTEGDNSSPSNAIAVLINGLGQGASQFLPPVFYVSGPKPRDVAVADIDGNGTLDVFAANNDGTLSVFANPGNGVLSAPLMFPLGAGGQPEGIAVADLDRDGLLDVVVGREGPPVLSILYHTHVAAVPQEPNAARIELAVRSENPARSGDVRFALRLARADQVRLIVHDAHGRRVRTLVSDVLPAGERAALWDGLDESGMRCASGLYFCTLSTPQTSVTRRVAWLH